MAEIGVKGAHQPRRAAGVAGLQRRFRRGAHAVPIGAQRFHDGGQHQAFHEGARGELRPEPAAFLGVQRLFEQGAEDGRLHLCPVLVGGGDEQIQLVRRHGQGFGRAVRAGAEQAAVEAQHGGGQGGGEAAGVHRAPQLAYQPDEGRQVAAAAGQQAGEAGAVRQQANGLREHAEDAAHQEGGDVLGRVARPGRCAFQGRGQLGEQGGNVARHLRPAQGRVQRFRVEPHLAQHVAHLRAAQVGQVDAEPLAVGKLGVVLAHAGEVRVQVQAEPHVAHDQEGRPAFFRRQVAGVALRLPLGLLHVADPGRGVADVGAVLRLRLGREQAGLAVGSAALLGLAHEARPAV